MTLYGIGGIPGCARGTAVIKPARTITVVRRSTEDPEAECARLSRAREAAVAHAEACYESALAEIGEDSAKIFRAYREILSDDAFFSVVEERVRAEGVCIDSVLEEEKQNIAAVFAQQDDPYLRERGTDIENVCNELLAALYGGEEPFTLPEGDSLVVFADDLTPTDTLKLDKARLAGFVTERGGATSHTAILAKTLGIPAILGLEGVLGQVSGGETALLYGEEGRLILSPDGEALAQFRADRERHARRGARLAAAALAPALAPDGRTVHICSNLGEADSAQAFDGAICDGVGLLRTEFLYMRCEHYPTEEEQFSFYRDMALATGEKALIIRTLDIGGDKQAPYMDLPCEDNPFLGCRAIRLCLERRDVFQTQLRAILRATPFGNVKIMFPMIVTLEELLEAKAVLAQAMDELEAEGTPFRREVEVGIMVETPAAAVLSDVLARHADFFSIGANDLIQYTTATDRMNQRLQYLYTSSNLSVLRLIRVVCKNAHAAGIPVGICGEAACEIPLLPLWLAFGVDELSMAPSQIGLVKHHIAALSGEDLRRAAEALDGAGVIADLRAVLAPLSEKGL